MKRTKHLGPPYARRSPILATKTTAIFRSGCTAAVICAFLSVPDAVPGPSTISGLTSVLLLESTSTSILTTLYDPDFSDGFTTLLFPSA